MNMNSLRHTTELYWKFYKTKKEGNECEDGEDVVGWGRHLQVVCRLVTLNLKLYGRSVRLGIFRIIIKTRCAILVTIFSSFLFFVFFPFSSDLVRNESYKYPKVTSPANADFSQREPHLCPTL